MYFGKIDIRPEYSEIKKVREFIKDMSMKHGFFNEFIECIELSIGELVTNIIKHGQKGMKEKSDIKVVAEKKEDTVYIFFEYVGNIPDQKRIEEVNKVRKADDVMELLESGRGIFLMYQLMDEVKYEKIENGARVTMTKKIKNN